MKVGFGSRSRHHRGFKETENMHVGPLPWPPSFFPTLEGADFSNFAQAMLVALEGLLHIFEGSQRDAFWKPSRLSKPPNPSLCNPWIGEPQPLQPLPTLRFPPQRGTPPAGPLEPQNLPALSDSQRPAATCGGLEKQLRCLEPPRMIFDVDTHEGVGGGGSQQKSLEPLREH